jgi:acetyl esterase
MARDRRGPSLAFQLLVYPVTHCNFTTSSYQSFAEGYMLTRISMQWYWDHYLQDVADATNPYAAPLAARDLSGLPPALVITAECDPLCDEGAAYAQRLKEAGVPTTYSCYDGMIHGFFGMPAALDKGSLAVAEASAALQKAFTAQAATAR